MKAIICTKYGPPEVLQIQEVAKPIPKQDEVLIKIISTAVNSGDVRVRSLDVKGVLKIVMRFVLGFSKPRKPILGTVFAGVIEEVGSKVSKFKVGEKVFGMTGFKFGTYAEYMTMKQSSTLYQMPTNANFDEAAALVFGGQTAIHFLDKMKIAQTPNANLLIIGATGSVGIAALQIAKYYGATVAAVCSSKGKALVERKGADKVMLYDKEDYLHQLHQFDFIFDAVGKVAKSDCTGILKKRGVYKTVGGMEVAAESVAQLKLLKELFEAGKLKPAIDNVFTFDEIVAAHAYVDTGSKKGNVVLKVADFN